MPGLRARQPAGPDERCRRRPYFRLWQTAFPQHPATADQTAQQVHYEKLFGPRIDDLEAALRRKSADPARRLADVDCAGRHHGRRVACRYAAATARRSGKGRR